MFYYLLARNCNMTQNVEEIASISTLKYIGLLIVLKIIEHKYLEPGFFNYYFLAFIAFDLIFSLYRYKKVADKEANKFEFCTDDVMDENFSAKDYASEINNIRTTFLKRKQTTSNIHNYKINKDVEKFNNTHTSRVTVDHKQTITPVAKVINMDAINETDENKCCNEVQVQNDNHETPCDVHQESIQQESPPEKTSATEERIIDDALANINDDF